MKQFFTIFKYEFGGIVGTKGYRITTAVIFVLLSLVLSWPSISGVLNINTSGDSAEQSVSETLMLFNAGQIPLNGPSLNAAAPGFKLSYAPDEQSVLDAVEREDASFGLILDTPLKFRMIMKYGGIGMEIASEAIVTELTRQYRALAIEQAGVSPELTEEILSTQVVAETVELGKGFEQTFAYSYALLIILYVAIVIYGSMVATSVATEKSSRTMELLITSAKPTSLIFGKVIGSGCAGLLQLGIILISAFSFYNANATGWGDVPIVGSLFGMPPDILAFAILFFLLGYFLYAFMYGALGSLVSRQEDVQSSTVIITLLLVAAYLVSIQGSMDPGGTPVTIASFIPFTAPMAMFIRISMTQVPTLELIISIGLCLLTLLGIGYLSAKIYRVGVLMYGNRPKLKDVFKMLRHS